MAAMAIGGQDYAQARKQLSPRYLHVWHEPAEAEGVVDVYEAWCRQNNLSTGGWRQFRNWAMNVYVGPGE